MKRSFEYNIDNIYREAFTNADTPFDKGEMWKNVSSSLSPDRHRPLLFWLSVLTGVLLISYFAISVSWQSSANQPTAAQLNEQNLLSSEQGIPHEQIAASQGQQKGPETPSPQFVPMVIQQDQENDVQKEKPSALELANNKKNITSNFDNPSLNKQIERNQKPSNDLLEQPAYGVDNAEELSILNATPVRLFEQEEELQLPDPKWSRCDVRDRPRYFSDFYVFGGYPLITNSLNPDPRYDYSGFLNEWNEGESAVATFAFGMLVGIGGHWGGSVMTGLEYQIMQNKVSRSQTVVERITVYDERAYFYLDSNNNRVWVADSVTSTRIYSRKVQAAKTHTLVNMPILLGYHLEKDNWRMGISAGVNLHLFHQFSGSVLDPSGQIIEAETGTSTTVYDTHMSVSFIAGFDIGYFVTAQTEIYVSPRFRYNPKSWLNNTHPLESRIQMAGLRAGARWHFY